MITAPYHAAVDFQDESWLVSETLAIDRRVSINLRSSDLGTRAVERVMTEQGWQMPPAMVDGVPTYHRERELPAEVPTLSWITSHFRLPRIPAGRAVIVPRLHSQISIVAPKGAVASTYPAESQRFDRLSDGEEEVVIEIGSTDLFEFRIGVVGPMLRSPQGHVLYRIGRWPVVPLIAGVVAIFTLGVFRERIKNLLSFGLRPAPSSRPAEGAERATTVSHPKPFLQRMREMRVAFVIGCLWLTVLGTILSVRVPGPQAYGNLLSVVAEGLGPLSGPVSLLLLSLLAVASGYLLRMNPQALWEFGGRPRWATRALRRLRRTRARSWIGVSPLSSEAEGELAVMCAGTAGRRPRSAGRVRREFLREIPGLAARLRAQERGQGWFEDHHRLLAEASLRLNIAGPVALLFLLLTWRLANDPWTTVLLMPGALVCSWLLVRQATRRAVRANDVIVRAVAAGDLASRALADPGGTPARPSTTPRR